ncbi:MAG: ion transporter [Opitutales bacterium]
MDSEANKTEEKKANLFSICQKLTTHPAFERSILAVIVFAGVLVGLETSPTIMENYGNIILFLDKLVLGIFAAEVVIKMLALFPRPQAYFKSGWNCFDFLIVAICLIPSSGSWVAVLRLFRILRVLRLITQIPKLQKLVIALLHSLPSLGYVVILLSMHFYVYAVIGVNFFRGNDPGHFGDLGLALLTLFRIVTLEDWTDVMYTGMLGSDVYNAQGAIPVGPDPHAFGIWAVIYFVSFVMVGALVMINLFIGVMVESLADAKAETKPNSEESVQNSPSEQLVSEIQDRLEELKSRLQK